MAEEIYQIYLDDIKPIEETELEETVRSFMAMFAKTPELDECIKQLRSGKISEDWEPKPLPATMFNVAKSRLVAQVIEQNGEKLFYRTGQNLIKEAFIFHLISTTPLNFGAIAPCVKCIYKEPATNNPFHILYLSYTEPITTMMSFSILIEVLAFFNKRYNLRYGVNDTHKIINVNGLQIIDFSGSTIFEQEPRADIKKGLPWDTKLEGDTYEELLESFNSQPRSDEFEQFNPFNPTEIKAPNSPSTPSNAELKGGRRRRTRRGSRGNRRFSRKRRARRH